MKPTMALKPLVFALTALLAVAAHADKTPPTTTPPTTTPPAYTLDPAAAATAVVADVQVSEKNTVTNKAALNKGGVNDSIKGTNGNIGANSAAGAGNQQDNAVAIATSDESFVMGTALALTSASQTSSDNKVQNYGTQNSGSLNDSIKGTSGNIGVNVAAGDLNQQKNNLAIAVSNGRVATAGAGATQTSKNLSVTNEAGPSFLSTVSTYSPMFQGGSYNNTPVSNNASINDSIKGVSGNVGANVAAGVGNQQSNSLSIAAGCKVCM